jgi:hypothetical protein
MTTQEQNNAIQAELQALRDELHSTKNENAKLKGNQGIGSIRITPKGGVSVYGLGRFPVTLYKSQWLKLISMAEAINTFIEVNSDKLTEKPVAVKAVDQQVDMPKVA